MHYYYFGSTGYFDFLHGAGPSQRLACLECSVVMQVAFEVMGYIAVITNFSLIALLPSVKQHSHGYSDVQVALFFVAAEVRACTVTRLSMGTHLRATERHLPCGITQCYLPPDTRERAPP